MTHWFYFGCLWIWQCSQLSLEVSGRQGQTELPAFCSQFCFSEMFFFSALSRSWKLRSWPPINSWELEALPDHSFTFSLHPGGPPIVSFLSLGKPDYTPRPPSSPRRLADCNCLPNLDVFSSSSDKFHRFIRFTVAIFKHIPRLPKVPE